jgi:hypothetical protein
LPDRDEINDPGQRLLSYEKVPAAGQGLRGDVEHWLGQREAAQERCRATVSKRAGGSVAFILA